MLNRAYHTAYTEVLTLISHFIFLYILPVQWRHYWNAASWCKTACLLIPSCSHSSLPIYKENLSYHSSCCLPSGNLLQTSELLAVCSCSLQIFSSILQDAECSWEKPVVLLHSLSHSSERAKGTLLLLYLTTFVNYCFPGLSEFETRHSVNDKFCPLPLDSRLRTAVMKSFCWNKCLYEERCPTHHLIYSAVKRNSERSWR